MGQIAAFFTHLLDTSDFPPRWHCGNWSSFHGWLYIISDLLIWSAYYTIPLIIVKYISKKSDTRYRKLYILFATFILACGTTHLIDAIIFWVPIYRISALVRLITGVVSWITVWQLFKYLPVAFAQRSVHAMEHEIRLRREYELQLKELNGKLEEMVQAKTQEVIATESRFRTIIEQSKEAFFLTDETFKPFYQNEFARQVSGWLALSTEGIAWTEYVHPEDVANLRTSLQEVRANAGATINVSFRVKDKQGTYRDMEGSVTNLLDQAYVKAIVINLRDVTERKKMEDAVVQSEKIYRTIAASIPDSVITIIDNKGVFTLAEGEGMARFGLSKAAIECKTQGDAMPADLYEVIAPLRKKVFEDGKARSHEVSFRGGDFILRFVPLKDEKNETYAIMTLTLDISEIKRAGREIQALNENLEKKVAERTNMLEAANKEMESFTYSVSHDLRAPLRIINGYAELLKMDDSNTLNAEGTRLLNVIMNSVQQMGALIDDLLKFSRLGRKEVVIRITNMNAVVREVIQEQMQLNKRAINFNIHYLQPAPCDSNLIKNVWANLISNAIKYSAKEEHPGIEITSDINGKSIVYSVRDNGVGFDMKYSDKLFGVFQRLHKKSEFEGTGVGLALVHRIISKHGGTVWAEAQENSGATFYFSLPLTGNYGTE